MFDIDKDGFFSNECDRCCAWCNIKDCKFECLDIDGIECENCKHNFTW